MPHAKSTQLIVFGPAVEFRISAQELQGLRYACFRIRWHLKDLAFALYDSEFAQRLDQMCGEVFRLAREKNVQTIRVHGDAPAMAALMFALRSIPGEIRRGKIPASYQVTDYTNLLKRLERYRRRAKRLWLKLGPADAYRDYRARWQRFLKGVHNSPPRSKDVVRAYYQKRMDEVLQISKEILATQDPFWVPLDPDLRPMVRTAILRARRGRASVGMRDLICNTPEARAFLSEYVGRQVRQLFWVRMRELEARGCS